MTNHVSLSAARAPRESDQTAQRNRDRSRRTMQAERDLAELEALLTKQLKRSPSPSPAAGNRNGEPPLRGRKPAWPRAAAPRSEPVLSARRTPHEPGQPPATDTESRPRAPEPGFSPALHRLEDLPPIAAMPRAHRRSPIARAMSIAATVFSLLALVAVSALLVMLAIGSEPTAQVAGNAANAGDSAVAAENAPDASPPAEQAGGPVVIGSTGAKQDESRVPSQGYTARAGGTVWAVDTQAASAQTPQAAESSPAENAPAANASIAREPAPGAFAAPSVFAPPAEEQASATGRGFAPLNSGAASAPEESVAPAQVAATESVGNSAGPAQETRSAPVTTHVNMRASPDNDAAVVVVVPEGRNVEVVECTQWCEVVYDGRQGFIHRRFVTGAGG